MEEFIGRGIPPLSYGIPPYAILSHTWGKEEVTFQDIQGSEAQNKAGFSKILSCCEQAKRDGLEWVWIDTCCIDKTSSTELSEAINSMFAWYQESTVCYAFLEDVSPLNPFFPENEFKQARWFKRGWCLQELIAPRRVEFYAADWTDIGTKWSLHQQIEDTTGIPSEILLGPRSLITSYTIAQKMPWASERDTTRIEDQAYCLLGIFGISMSLLYGEGKRAFIRLQEEILKQTEDYSLLLWTDESSTDSFGTWTFGGVLPPSPRVFPRNGLFEPSQNRCDYRNIKSIFLHRDSDASKVLSQVSSTQWNPPQMTSRGLHIHMFVQKSPPIENTPSLFRHPWPKEISTELLLWTGCMYKDQYICIMLEQRMSGGVLKYARSMIHRIRLVNRADFSSFELAELYLITETRSSGGIIRIPENHKIDLEVILSTKCEETVSFVESDPPIKLGASHCPQSQQLHCLHLQTRVKLVVMRFQTTQPTSGIITDYFTVFFKQINDMPWCTIAVKPGTDPVPPEDYAIQDPFSHIFSNGCRQGGLVIEKLRNLLTGMWFILRPRQKTIKSAPFSHLNHFPPQDHGRRRRVATRHYTTLCASRYSLEHREANQNFLREFHG